MDAMSDGPMTKGGGFSGSFDAAKAMLTPEQFAIFLEALLPPLREAHETRTLIATKWYPLDWERSITHAVVRALGGDPTVAADEYGYRESPMEFVGYFRVGYAF